MVAPPPFPTAAGEDSSTPARAQPGTPTIRTAGPEIIAGWAGPVRMRTPVVRMLRNLIQFRPQVAGRGDVSGLTRTARPNRADPAGPMCLRSDAA